MEHNIRTYTRDKKLILSRRLHIARCAARLLVKQGYDRTSIREIADACSMGIGTLYRYVGSKEDILYLVIDDGLSQYVDFCEKSFADLDMTDPSRAIRQAIKQYYRLVDSSQDLMLFAYQETKNLLPEARQSILDMDRRIVAAFAKLLTIGSEMGIFHIENATQAAQNIVILGQIWAVRRWSYGESYPVERYIKEQSDFILRAISGYEEPKRDNRHSVSVKRSQL